MAIKSDYHTHTYLCKHATGHVNEYLQKAYDIGLETIGISDHCPSPKGFDINNRMNPDDLETYINFIEEAKNNSFNLNVLFGWEIDWVPGKMDKIRDFVSKTDYDYLICSTHYLDNLPIDNSNYKGFWETPDKIQQVWDKYADNIVSMVDFGKFDIIGHIDLPKKYKKYPNDLNYFYSKIEAALKIAARKNILMEINTAGLRKQVGKIYPDPYILEIAYKQGVEITFGSDAHSPEEVGYEFLKAKELALKIGYKYYTQLKEDGYRDQVKL